MDALAPLLSLVAATLNAGTPLLLAAIGVLVAERSGVVNLGVEGMMLVAAVLAFACVHITGSYLVGFGVGMLAGALLAALFAAFALGLLTNQYATGLALALFGAGLSAFIGIPYSGENLPARAADGIPLLRDLPVLGPMLFSLHWLVYLALLLVVAVAWFLFRTRAGLVLRAVGEAPESAHALGYPVRLIRLVLGAYLFGGVTMLQLYLQGLGVQWPSHIMSMTPHIATIVVLAVISRNPRWIRLNMPASLGRSFNPHA